MEFRLGALGAWDRDREVPLGGPKPRALAHAVAAKVALRGSPAGAKRENAPGRVLAPRGYEAVRVPMPLLRP